MSLITGMRSTASALSVERTRMDLISVNLANANSMRTPDQDAFRRRVAILTGGEEGVKVEKIDIDRAELRREADPTHPYADAEGFVYYSNVQPIREMVDMMGATRAYEANIAAFNAAKGMVRSAMTIGRV